MQLVYSCMIKTLENDETIDTIIIILINGFCMIYVDT